MGPSTAYDIVVNVFDTTHEVGPGAPDWPSASSGWAFGMPPAIRPEQWPLDPDTGYPLMHGFTLQLPEEYRCHGPEIVGVSFFGSPPDHEEGTRNPRVAAALAADTPPSEPDLLPFYEAQQRRHPRAHFMIDVLDAHYAVILLTAEELAGPRTMPPPLVDSPALAEVPAPRWLTEGSIASIHHPRFASRPYTRYAKPEEALKRILGFAHALTLVPRREDPNAGRPPVELPDGGVSDEGYVCQWLHDEDEVHKQPWARGHDANHIGGTCQPWQDVPDGLSPYYIEFNEWIGNFNFGGGNGRLDLLNLTFEWDCG
ncbi:hypothetical protein GCM10027055_30650 [Janibacter alkaliphilus]|uniref:DUF1963 domain-containing protein n=1 Tax=Janibacter alkaliphilus TaxID=1069963 RepID=A0A852XD19_9MICO|nr:hypothetical protein [Janibacter alkaliphilus]NYG36355.1 hypothetical protein [Janibacter alkaliphilus]